MASEQVATMLQGSAGSTVELELIHGDQEYSGASVGVAGTSSLENVADKANKIAGVVYVNIFRDVEEIDLRSAAFLAQTMEVGFEAARSMHSLVVLQFGSLRGDIKS